MAAALYLLMLPQLSRVMYAGAARGAAAASRALAADPCARRGGCPNAFCALGPAADEEPLEIGQTSALAATGALRSAPVAKRYRRGLQTPLWSNPFVELLGAVADEGKLICAPQRPNIARRKLSQREWPQTSRRGAVLVFLGAPRDAPAAQAKKQDTSRGSQKSPCAAVSATPTASKRAPRTPVPRAPPLRAARAPPKMFASHR